VLLYIAALRKPDRIPPHPSPGAGDQLAEAPARVQEDQRGR
jgi:hypothetical protein